MKYDTQAAASVVPSLPSTATATGGEDVPIQSTTEIIHPTVCHLLESKTSATVAPTLPPIATVTDDNEVQIRATTEVINTTVQICAGAEVPIQSTTKIINPTVCYLLVSQTAKTVAPAIPPIATVTGDTKVQICATTEVINIVA